MRRPAAAAPVFACLLLASSLAACGDDGDDPPARALTVPAGKALRVTGDEYSFDPARVVVGGSGRVKIELENRGALAHNLRVLRHGEELGGTPTFQGGKTRSATLRLAPGSYRMVCTVGNHEQLGMSGTLEIR